MMVDENAHGVCGSNGAHTHEKGLAVSFRVYSKSSENVPIFHHAGSVLSGLKSVEN